MNGRGYPGVGGLDNYSASLVTNGRADPGVIYVAFVVVNGLQILGESGSYSASGVME